MPSPSLTESNEAINVVNSLKVDDDLKSFVASLDSDVRAEESIKKSWDSRIAILRNLRYGYRTVKTHPWPKCANYSIPLIDSYIQKAKPIYINLFYNSSPIVNFEPFGAEDIEPAKKREQLFDWRLKTKVDFFNEYCVGIDKMLEQGTTVFKITWEYETRSYTELIDLEDLDEETLNALADARVTDEVLIQILVEEYGIDTNFEENIEALFKAILDFRSGKNQIELTLLEVSKNHPKVVARDLKEDLVIPRGTMNIQDARFIEDKIWTNKNDIKTSMRDKKYHKFSDEEIESWGVGAYEEVALRRVNPQTKVSDIILLKEVCTWKDVNDDGIQERVVITYPSSSPTSILRCIEIPYDHGMFPYEEVRREFVDSLMYTARGIPEIAQDFQIGVSEAFNQTQDNGTILNSPFVVAQKNTVTNIKNRKYVPGEYIETLGTPENYQVRQMGNAAQPLLLNFTQHLKSWADNRMGDVTSGLTSPLNMAGQGALGQKTKAEVNLVSVLSQEISSLDVLVFQMQMIKVYRQIDALYDQYGDDEEEFLITGEKPVSVSRREIQCKYNMVANGRLDNTDQAKKVAIAQSVYSSGLNDPAVRQLELKKYYYGSIDPRLAKMLLYTEEEIQQMQAQSMAQREALRSRAVKEGLDMQQIEMLLEVQKEALMVPITGKKYSKKD